MTPTRQDKELREKIKTIIIGFDGGNWYGQKADSIMQLIAADRKRVALEARIHEIGLMQHQARVNLKTSNAMAQWGDIRIAELKAQQEEI